MHATHTGLVLNTNSVTLMPHTAHSTGQQDRSNETRWPPDLSRNERIKDFSLCVSHSYSRRIVEDRVWKGHGFRWVNVTERFKLDDWSRHSYLHILIQLHDFLDASKWKLLHAKILLKQSGSVSHQHHLHLILFHRYQSKYPQICTRGINTDLHAIHVGQTTPMSKTFHLSTIYLI